MRSNIKKIGNSKGVIIPPAFLSELNLDQNSGIDIELNNEGILIKPVFNPRQNWEEMFMKAIENKEIPDSDLSNGLSNEFDDTEWTW